MLHSHRQIIRASGFLLTTSDAMRLGQEYFVKIRVTCCTRHRPCIYWSIVQSNARAEATRMHDACGARNLGRWVTCGSRTRTNLGPLRETSLNSDPCQSACGCSQSLIVARQHPKKSANNRHRPARVVYL